VWGEQGMDFNMGIKGKQASPEPGKFHKETFHLSTFSSLFICPECLNTIQHISDLQRAAIRKLSGKSRVSGYIQSLWSKLHAYCHNGVTTLVCNDVYLLEVWQV